MPLIVVPAIARHLRLHLIVRHWQGIRDLGFVRPEERLNDAAARRECTDRLIVCGTVLGILRIDPEEVNRSLPADPLVLEVPLREDFFLALRAGMGNLTGSLESKLQLAEAAASLTRQVTVNLADASGYRGWPSEDYLEYVESLMQVNEHVADGTFQHSPPPPLSEELRHR